MIDDNLLMYICRNLSEGRVAVKRNAVRNGAMTGKNNHLHDMHSTVV